ncbi:hypothetical protein GDO86_011616 [Hymenochirus boettgeri]|uniref:Uncharacterized protein n=1 Tax=Hymenochirus boettgeri TaxID=247094 RepID=A0A8T2JH92_9PIPI|nr:hypothetical protein GDO86_011616 [Hymenochirus boettgeri]
MIGLLLLLLLLCFNEWNRLKENRMTTVNTRDQEFCPA